VRRAAKVHPICDVQLEYGLVSRQREKIIPTLRELGIAMTAYGVLSRGLLAGTSRRRPGDTRAHFPALRDRERREESILVDALARIAREKAVTARAARDCWVPREGARAECHHRAHARPLERAHSSPTCLRGLDVTLDASEVAALEAAVPAEQIAGARYPAPGMVTLDSEM
jgi:aryl-alcohol dehydrogenase-like predicted oxidoreductase